MSDIERKPAECFPPGEFVKDELEARGITVAAFGAAMGWNEREANEFLAGRRHCGVAETEKLARMFGTSPLLWLNLQRAWVGWQRLKEQRAV